MQITYLYTQEDFAQFYTFLMKRQPMSRVSKLLNFLFLIGSIGFCLWQFSTMRITLSWHSWATVPLLLPPVFIAFAVVSMMSPRRMAKTIARQMSKTEKFVEHTITIDAEWVSDRTAMSETKTRWESVQEIVDREGYIYFVGGAAARVIPKRAFPSPTIAEEFVRRAQAYWSHAKQGTPLPEFNVDVTVWPPAPQVKI